MKKFLTLAGLALALAASAPAASAQQQQPSPQDGQRQGERKPFGRHGRRGDGPDGGGRRMMRALSRLNLTEAQQTQIRSINEATRLRTEAQRTELRQLFETLRGGGQLTAQQQARAEQLRQELHAARESANQQIMNVLTAEQRAQLEQWKQERRSRRDGMRRHRRPADDINN